MLAKGFLLGFALAASMLTPSPSLAEPSSPSADPVRQPTATPTAESEYDRGIRARLTKDWTAAVEAQRAAVTMRPAFPEAWNELGFALRNQGRYPESLDAYGEALRLRPNYPEALEYLGEAYVKLGRMEDARKVLDRLRPLDRAKAQELAEVIRQGK
ncbi:MAG TPA: tetratricopeptide repeat protein [Methylomirabilota bacterium]|nr:tetratricopeptide repeat protein [Methylomirabilota bacterium]